MKICIIGAGPAGNYAAYLLSKSGYEVVIFEKNPKIGPPVQCTGILSDHFKEILGPKDEFVLNTVEKTRIYAPNGNFLEARIKTNYVICRKKFDNYLANLAKGVGAKYYLEHSFKSATQDKEGITILLNNRGKDINIKSDILIGADGPLSPVSKQFNIYKRRKHLIGTQIEAKKENDNTVEFYPYLGCYSWIVPVNKKTVRIGVAAYKDSQKIFKEFAHEKIGKDYPKKILEHQSGVIPVFDPSVTVQRGKVFSLGDAATFVKATSGGGINQSLKSAEILANCISNKLNYEKEWKRYLYKNLHTHLIVHKMMKKFSKNDWNQLIKIFSKPKMKKILYSRSRDKLLPMLFKVAITNPSVFRFIRYFPTEELKNFRYWLSF